jgi:hypothetical protein
MSVNLTTEYFPGRSRHVWEIANPMARKSKTSKKSKQTKTLHKAENLEPTKSLSIKKYVE